jgi:hypothetical protein
MAETDSRSPENPMLTVPMDGAAAQLLADQAVIVQDLQFVIDCCRRLLAELDKPDTARDGVMPQALWSAALVSYSRCFANGKKYGLQTDDVRALPLQGAVLKFHLWVLEERDKMASHPTNPFDGARVGVALAPEGKRRIEGIAIMSASHVLVDDVGVRQLGGLASELAKAISEKAQKQQDTVLADARKYNLDSLYNRKPLQAGPAPDQDPDENEAPDEAEVPAGEAPPGAENSADDSVAGGAALEDD